MPRRLTDKDVVDLVQEAQAQLDAYFELAELAKLNAAVDSLQPPHEYRWDVPLGLVICDTDVNGFVVRTTG